METMQAYIIQRLEGHQWIDWIVTLEKEHAIDIFERWKHLVGYRLVERMDTIKAIGGTNV